MLFLYVATLQYSSYVFQGTREGGNGSYLHVSKKKTNSFVYASNKQFIYIVLEIGTVCVFKIKIPVSVTEVNRFICLLLIGESLYEYIDQYIDIRCWIYLWWEKNNLFGVDQTIQFLKVKTKILKDLKKQVF